MDGKADGGAEEGRTVEQLMEDIHTLAEEVRKNDIGVAPFKYDPDAYYFKFHCGSCHHPLIRDWGYCPRCGKKVDWDAAD